MADISYTPTTWADGSEGGTPIDATKLNNIESGIVDAVAAIGPNDTTADGTLKAQIDALGESVNQGFEIVSVASNETLTVSSGSLSSFSASLTKTGYTVLGIVGIAVNGNDSRAFRILSFNIDTSTNTAWIQCEARVSGTYGLHVKTLYFKNF